MTVAAKFSTDTLGKRWGSVPVAVGEACDERRVGAMPAALSPGQLAGLSAERVKLPPGECR